MHFHLGFGQNKVYGIEMSFFSFDHLDYEVHSWDFISIKLLVKIFVPVYVFGFEAGRDRTSIGVLNCFLSVFYN
jgi:hypothetical protein